MAHVTEQNEAGSYLELLNEGTTCAKFDIIIVPSIGVDPRATCLLPANKQSESPTLFDELNIAEISLYHHGQPPESQNDLLSHYAIRLVSVVQTFRERTSNSRPIHLVAHGTGGLVVKKALLLHPDYAFSRQCFSVAFFGVPHRGSAFLSRDLTLSNVDAAISNGQAMSSNISRRQTDEHRWLTQLDDDFVRTARKLRKIWTFVEGFAPTSSSMISTPHRLVEFRSATLNIAQETVSELSLEHGMLLCRNGPPPDKRAKERYLISLRHLGEAAALPPEQDVDQWIRDHLNVDAHLFHNLGSSRESPFVQVRKARLPLQLLLTGSLAGTLRTDDAVSDIALAKPQNMPKELRPSPSGPTEEIPSLTVTDSERDGQRVLENASDHLSLTVTSRPNLLFRNIRQASVTTLNLASPDESEKLHDKREIFKWIRVPCNHSGWVHEVIDCVASSETSSRLHKGLLHDEVWYRQQHNPRHGLPHGRFVQPFCRGLTSGSEPSTKNSPTSAGSFAQLALSLPYLHWDTFERLQARSAVIAEGIKKGSGPATIRPEPCKEIDLEFAMLRQYLGGFEVPPIHPRRSLDQFGYPMLKGIARRDQDQILYKRTRERKHKGSLGRIRCNVRGAPADQAPPSKSWFRTKPTTNNINIHQPDEFEGGNVLVVDQMWMFVVDSSNIITFFPSKATDETARGDEYGTNAAHESTDLFTRISREVCGDPSFTMQCQDCFDLAALIVYHAVTILLSGPGADALNVLQIFEECMSEKTDEQATSFANYLQMKDNLDPSAPDLSVVDEVCKSDEDLANLFELQDLQDELRIMTSLFGSQVEIVQEMRREYKKIQQYRTGVSGPSFAEDLFSRAIREIESYNETAETIMSRCKEGQTSYNELLDVKQRQASAWETRLATQLAVTTNSQNRSIIAFTIFTVIFLPLSFMTSLFGINTSSWAGQSSDTHFLTLHVIFVLTFSISAALIVVALLLAFNHQIRHWYLAIWYGIDRSIIAARRWLVSERRQRYYPSGGQRIATALPWTNTEKSWTEKLNGKAMNSTAKKINLD